MEVDLDLILQNLNATATDDRKSGINKFLDAIKNYYLFDINENNSNIILILFSNQMKINELFATIGRLLRDPDWKIRKDTFEILITIITKDILKDKLDFYISNIIKHLINCLSDTIITVRKIATQCFHEYLNKSLNFEKSMKDFIEYGFHNSLDFNQRQDNNQALQVILTPNFSKNNFNDLIIGVLKQLNCETEKNEIEPIVISVLKCIKKIIGDERFNQYIKNLPANIAPLYERCSTGMDSSQSYNSTPSPWNGNDNGKSTNTFSSINFQSKKLPSLSAPTNEILHFGFIPQSVIDDINNDRKLEATEEICNIFSKNSEKQIANILPHFNDLLLFIRKLMEDKYLVIMTACKLLIEVVSTVSDDVVNQHLDMLMQLLRVALIHNMNGDAIIQKYTMLYVMVLFQKSNTKELVNRLCDSQFMNDFKQASIRQMSIDIIISALLKFPSTKFDLDFICGKVSQRLLDKKQKVKQAALECISVIGYNYGNGKISTLLKTVEIFTKTDFPNNISELVQARLSKHKLPHVDDCGIVVYVTENDKISNQQRKQSFIELENSSSDNSPISSANHFEKRRPSAGKVRGRAKFPWDQSEGNCNSQKAIPLSKAPGLNSYNQIQPSDAMPIQYSQGPLSITSKELLSEGRTIRKLSDLQASVSVDGDRNSSKSQPVTGRSFSTETNSSNSNHTTGYSTVSNTYRNHYEHISKQNKDNKDTTATNSTNVTPRNNPGTNRYEECVNDNSPIPTKPALGRSAGSRRKELEINTNNTTAIFNDKSSNGFSNPNDNQNEEISSPLLQVVRNSASKKKALKLFNTSNASLGTYNGDQELHSTRSPNMPANIVKYQQDNSNLPKTNESQNFYNPQKGATFKANPQYAALVVGKGVMGPPIENNDIQISKKKQPIKGIHHSFSLVQLTDSNLPDIDKNNDDMFSKNIIVNKNININLMNGLNDIDESLHKNNHFASSGIFVTNTTDNELKTKPNPYQNLYRQKVTSETSLNPLYFSVNYLNNEDGCSPNQLSSRLEFNVIGKSMLDSSTSNFTQRTTSNNTYNEPKKIFRNESSHNDVLFNNKNVSRNSTIGQPVPDFNNEIIGIGLTDKMNIEDDSDEEPNKGIMSETLRESLSLKRQKVANELNSYKSDSNITPPALAINSAPGSGSHQAAHRKPPMGSYYYSNTLPSSAGNERDITNGYETVPPSRKPLRPALGNSTPKKIKPASQTLSNPQTNSAAESISINPTPLNNPDKSVNECMTLIQNEDWEIKISAMIIIQSLVQFHSEVLLTRSPDLHAICIALCKECKNLRSQVAKIAIQTVGQLFNHLKKNMDFALENIVSNLLSKAGEGTNSFLKQDVESALAMMIENVSPQRAFIALLQTGSDHKNIAIRRLTACNIVMLCEKIGSAKTMSCIKEMPEKILLGIIKFAMDGNQETRYYGKKMLFELNKHPDFEKIYNKHIPPKDLRILKDIIDNIKSKGIGDPPASSHSAGIQRSGSLSRGGSAGNLVALGSKSSPLSRGSSRSMTRLPGSDLSDDDKDWLTNTCLQLSSSDFRNRQTGLESLLSKAELNGLEIPQKSISKLLKDFIPRLNDNNTKVTITALYICQKIIPFICSIFPNEFFSEFINTIALNFASKSAELRDAASILMNVCFANLDHSLLIQPCIEAINKSNSKTKPIVIENMNYLLTVIQTSKSSSLNRSIGVIIRHLIPEIGLLLEKNRPLPPTLKESVHNLVVLTYEIVGSEMIDSAAQRGDHTLKQAIIEILNIKNINTQ